MPTLKRLRNFRKMKFMRGGFVPGTPLMRRAWTAGKGAMSLYNDNPAVKTAVNRAASGAGKKIGEGFSKTGNFLTDVMKTLGPTGVAVNVSLNKSEISSQGNGDITETMFISKQKSTVSNSVKAVLSSATSMVYKYQQGGQIFCPANGQAAQSLYGGDIIGTPGALGTVPPTTTTSWSMNSILGGNSVFESEDSTNWGPLYSLYRSVPYPNAPSATIPYMPPDVGFFYLDSHRGELVVTNTTSPTISNGAAIVDIYELLAKKDFQGTGTAITTRQLTDPYDAWQDGMQNYGLGNEVASLGLATRLSTTTIGCVPNQSQTFNVYWDICAKTRITLSPGANHIHKSTYTYQDMIPVVHVYRSALLGGISRNFLIVCRGTVARTTTNSNIIDNNASIAWTYNATVSAKMLFPTQKFSTQVYTDLTT